MFIEKISYFCYLEIHGCTIQENNRSIAQIIPLQEGFEQTLLDLDLLTSKPVADWKSLKLNLIEFSADQAIHAISSDEMKEDYLPNSLGSYTLRKELKGLWPAFKNC